MRLEKTFKGIKTILEGAELEKLIEIFESYNLDKVQTELDEEDPLTAMQMIAFKAYAKLHPNYQISVEKVMNLSDPDTRKANLLFRWMAFSTMKALLPDMQWQNYFEVDPLAVPEPAEPKIVPGTDLTLIPKAGLDLDEIDMAAFKEILRQTERDSLSG